MIVTIDGPSGTGKTTVARRLAEKIGFVYFDTGAMYRALTWQVLEKNVDISIPEQVDKILAGFDFRIDDKEGQKRYFLGDVDVTEVIRSRVVTSHVSQVAAQKQIRAALLPIQHLFAQNKNVVFEGRDLGTVVFPHAEVKIYLDADPQVRAERRLQEVLEKRSAEHVSYDHQKMLEEIIRRDAYDSSREVAPLRCPPDAHLIDTGSLTIDQVIDAIALIVKSFSGVL
ncbi:MAG: (d)CMP kinase [Chlamydiales bacterium]|nr:(d)CMP kinase [Chlamydiales bacterium]